MTHTLASRQLIRKGMLRSVALLIVWAITTVGANAQTFTNLWKFSNSDGANPYGTLVLGTDGSFYGTTSNGGNLNDCQLHGCGTIFRITPSGALSDIYQFTGGADGAMPQAGVIQVNGVLYGTTSWGGNIDTEQGTIFSINQDGSNFTVLYTFSGGADGGHAGARLLLGKDGNLYGTTSQGGQGQNSSCIPNGCGTIFSIAPDGSNFTTLYQFYGGNQVYQGPTDGSAPEAGLIQDSSGNFYGTTNNGGALCTPTLTCGTVFMFQLPNTLTTLHSFNGTTDGSSLDAPLVLGQNGTLYGTAQAGGNLSCGINIAQAGCGTIFSVNVNGSAFNVVWTFQGSENLPSPDGAQPFGELVLGTDGNLYGTTAYGGASCIPQAGCGTIYSIAPAGGAPTILHSFAGSDGSLPVGGLIESNGTFYATTSDGGNSVCTVTTTCGTVFSIAVSSQGKTSTVTTAMVTPSSIEQGATGGVTLSATVSPTSGSGLPTGTVTLLNGTTQVGQQSLSAGMASISYNTSALATGSYSITAAYGGDNNFNSSTSAAAALTVTANSSLIPTTTSVSITAAPSTSQSDVGSTVSFSASISHSSGSANPSGTVTFSSDGKVIGSSPISAGAASFSTSSLSVGQYSVSAAYSGDSNYAASTSTTVTLNVVDFQISATPATVTVSASGQTGSANITITPLGGFNQALTFTCSGLPSGANCTFGNSANGATLTISTEACTTASAEDRKGGMLIYAMLLPGLLGFVPAGARKRSVSGVRLLVLLTMLGLVSMCVGCSAAPGNTPPPGGGCKGGTPVGTSTITVTAAAGSLSHSATLTLSVQ